MMVELKPCPFCGGSVRLDWNWVSATIKGWYFLCEKCEMLAEPQTVETEAEAIEAWNRRVDNE